MKTEFFDKVKELALALGYDGLPPGDGGPDLSQLSQDEMIQAMFAMEEFLINELTARSKKRHG